jgi:hypothetical protein
LARINADKPEDDDTLRKKLWLSIAKHVVHENNNVKSALEVLKQSNLLKIEDVLLYFPDFILIDDFKVKKKEKKFTRDKCSYYKIGRDMYGAGKIQ